MINYRLLIHRPRKNINDHHSMNDLRYVTFYGEKSSLCFSVIVKKLMDDCGYFYYANLFLRAQLDSQCGSFHVVFFLMVHRKRVVVYYFKFR